MATVFETRLIGNIGKDAVIRTMDKGTIAVNFPVAHNKNWRDKRTGEAKTKTTWVNCTIWKKEGSNMRILDFLKKGALIELIGTPYAKSYAQENGNLKTEIRLNVSKTNILRPSKDTPNTSDDYLIQDENEDEDAANRSFTISEDDF